MTGSVVRPIPEAPAPDPSPPRDAAPAPATPGPPAPAHDRAAGGGALTAEADAAGTWPDAPAGTLDEAPRLDDEDAPWPDESAAPPVAGRGRRANASEGGAPGARAAAARPGLPGREPTPTAARPAVEALRTVFPGRVVRFVPAAPAERREGPPDDAPVDATHEVDTEPGDDSTDGGPT